MGHQVGQVQKTEVDGVCALWTLVVESDRRRYWCCVWSRPDYLVDACVRQSVFSDQVIRQLICDRK